METNKVRVNWTGWMANNPKGVFCTNPNGGQCDNSFTFQHGGFEYHGVLQYQFVDGEEGDGMGLLTINKSLVDDYGEIGPTTIYTSEIMGDAMTRSFCLSVAGKEAEKAIRRCI